MWNTPRHDAYGNFSFAFQRFKPDSQHVALPEVYCLKTEMVHIFPHIDEVRVPGRPKGVYQADVFIFPDSGSHNPIFAAFKDNYNSPQAFRVHMEWTYNAISSNQRPLGVSLGVRNFKHSCIVRSNMELGDFMRRHAPKVRGNVKVPLVSW